MPARDPGDEVGQGGPTSEPSDAGRESPEPASRSPARFDVGQLVHHRRFDYRGVVVDVDATFEGTDEWYEQVARSRPPRDRPWYHVLPDGASHTTYVAERNLEPDTRDAPIEHPLVEVFFDGFHDGRYERRDRVN